MSVNKETKLNKMFLWIILHEYQVIGLMNRVFGNGLGDRGSITGRVIPKTQKW